MLHLASQEWAMNLRSFMIIHRSNIHFRQKKEHKKNNLKLSFRRVIRISAETFLTNRQ